LGLKFEQHHKEDKLMRQKRVKFDAIQRQVATVKNEAVYLLIIKEDKTVEATIKKNGLLKVIAVIGEHRNDQYNLDEAVLLEIGMNRSRPYRVLQIPRAIRKPGQSRRLQPRHDGFQLTTEQYELVAPIVFSCMLHNAIEQISARTSGWTPYNVKALGPHNKGEKITKPVIARRSGRLAAGDVKYGVMPRVRFTVAMGDELLVRDVFWAEIYGNPLVQAHMRAIGEEITKLLAETLRKSPQTPENWSKSSYFSLAMERFGMFTQDYKGKLRDRSYLQKMVLRDQIGPQNYFYDEIAHRLGWDDHDPIPEEQLAKAALPDPKRRVGDIQLKMWRKFGDLLGIDLFPERPEDS
jgi:hypothetical protein